MVLISGFSVNRSCFINTMLPCVAIRRSSANTLSQNLSYFTINVVQIVFIP